ncbi:MAG TPA: hypothetical protein VHO29_03935 [Marmoricola sp.]|nr:hypothetical protein [Marmoricola sp.]
MNAWWRTVVALGITGLLVGWPTGVQAARDGSPAITVSTDGVTWSADLPAPLFHGAERWVPGDQRIRSFLVHNGADGDASVSLEPRDSGTRRLTEAGSVALYARSDGGAWHRLSVGKQSARLGAALPAGAVTRVDIRASFDPTSANGTQLQEARLSFVVRLTEAALAPTGFRDSRLVVVAGLLIGTGLGLVRRPRVVRRG